MKNENTATYVTIYRSLDKKASVLQDRHTGALRYRYDLGDGWRFCLSTWAEVGERAKHLFAPFWREKGITNPLALPSVDHGAEKPYISDRLPD